jgi:hypothetical protein
MLRVHPSVGEFDEDVVRAAFIEALSRVRSVDAYQARLIQRAKSVVIQRPHQPATKTTLWTMNQVRRLQQNPELGAFRIHAALEQLGIHLSTRTCGRILARNRTLYGLRSPEAEPREPKPGRSCSSATPPGPTTSTARSIGPT